MSTKAERQKERHDRREQRRGWRKGRRRERRESRAALWRKVRPALPVALVTELAMFGQILFLHEALLREQPAMGWIVAVVLAVFVGVAFESISLHVQWHAHDSLLHGHTLTAARQRKASYLIALVGATVNYSHFARDDWTPTILAVVFAAFSLASPPLWGLHTRRLHKVQLSREGRLDVAGAVFSAERYRWFPIRTLRAVRWSIDHGVTDPAEAWEGFKAEQRNRLVVREAEKVAARGARPAASGWFRLRWPRRRKGEPAVPEKVAITVHGIDWPDRTAIVDTERDPAVVADIRLQADRFGRRPSRDVVAAMYGFGGPKARRLLMEMGWMTEAGPKPETNGQVNGRRQP